MPDQRDAYLDQLCTGDVELRQNVAVMLKAHAAGEGPLDRGALRDEQTGAYEQSAERPGTVIGPYKLLVQIGEGGMGTVFMAEQTRPVRRKVALKIIKPGMDTKQVTARFEAERQALALMDHPHIAKVHDGGTTPTGRPYFIMELVKGTPITDYCDTHRLTTRDRLTLFLDVCHAIQHAHQKGIIHRDLKPSNVLVEVHDVRPVIKVIDFGIAKAIGQQLTDHTPYTGVAQLVGTPLYMSPEQAGLSSLDVDTRSDVYSLGVLLYELLTGTTPFDSETLKQAGYDEMRRIIREDEPPRPSTRLSTLEAAVLSTVADKRRAEPRKLSTQLRGELDWIVMKALEKGRNRRYESASAFAQDLQRSLDDEPVQACPPSAGYRLRKFARRHKGRLTVVAALAVGLLAAVLLGGGMLWSWQRQQTLTAQAVGEDLREAELWQKPELWQKQERWPEARQALERATGRLARGGSASLSERVEARRRDAALVARLEEARLQSSAVRDKTFDYAGSDWAYETAFAEHGLAASDLTPEEAAGRIRTSAIRVQLVAALDEWAYIKDRLRAGSGDALRAVAGLADDDRWRGQLRDPQVLKDRAALERLAAEEGVLLQPPANLVLLAGALSHAKGWAAAVALLRRAQQRYPADFHVNYELAFLLTGAPGMQAEAVGFLRAALALRPDNTAVYNNLGIALYYQGKHAEAEAAYRKALELNAQNVRAYINLGNVLGDQRQFPQAEAAYQKAIELQPGNALAYTNLGATLADQKRLAEAVHAHKEAIKLQPDFADAHYNLGNALRLQGTLGEAEAAYREAIRHNPDYADAYANLGIALFDQKRPAEAVEAYRKAIKLKPNDADAHTNLGNALREQGKLAEAVAAHQQAVKLKPDLALAYNNLGVALREQGKPTEAEAAHRKAIELQPDNALAYNNLGNALGAQERLARSGGSLPQGP
jgi:serine/threonine protein kinase/tetratricopeptide (TPR) repeat protein